jgi:hypothetical protein
MRPLIAILILLVASVATAQPLVIGTGLNDGSYVLTVENGRVTQFERALLIVPDGPVPPPIPDPDDPQPSNKAAQIKAASGAVVDPTKGTTASNLAAMLDLVANQTQAGTLKDYRAISESVNWMWDQMTKGREQAWKPVKDLIGNHLMALAQEGATPEMYAGYFAEAADAINASVPVTYDAEADDQLRINPATLMMLFEMFMKYILPFIINR